MIEEFKGMEPQGHESESYDVRLLVSYRGGIGVLVMAIGLLCTLGAGRAEPLGTSGSFRNSLGMIFLKVKGSLVMFSMWETRVSDWDAYVADTHQSWSHAPTFQQSGTHPVVNVTLPEAAAFAEWLTQKERKEGKITSRQTYRLPTNREWDAAVGLNNKGETLNVAKYPWGSEWPPPRQAGNYNSRRIEGGRDDGFEYTAPVGQFRPSPDGLFDLGGNAWEWACDTRTPAQTAMATLRGGSWLYWRKECLESAYHYDVKADLRSPTVGFRCVLENAAEIEAARERADVADQQERSRLLDRPTATAEEVREAQNRLAITPSAMSQDKARSQEVHKSVVTPGQAFTNSLAYRMLPLPDSRAKWLGEHEVRERDFQMFLLAVPPAEGEPRRLSVDGDHAMANVSWTEASVFCQWLTDKEREEKLIPAKAQYRLPTAAEWKQAAFEGQGKNGAFPWGGAWPPPAHWANLGAPLPLGHVAGVKTFATDGGGFYDLTGNVAEWCFDGPPNKDGVRWYCGGSWQTSGPDELRDGAVTESGTTTRLATVGFRLLLEFTEQDQPGPAKSTP